MLHPPCTPPSFSILESTKASSFLIYVSDHQLTFNVAHENYVHLFSVLGIKPCKDSGSLQKRFAETIVSQFVMILAISVASCTCAFDGLRIEQQAMTGTHLVDGNSREALYFTGNSQPFTGNLVGIDNRICDLFALCRIWSGRCQAKMKVTHRNQCIFCSRSLTFFFFLPLFCLINCLSCACQVSLLLSIFLGLR